jgi:uncharacterized protein (TIGR02757 family)
MQPKPKQLLDYALSTFHHKDYLGHDPVVFINQKWRKGNPRHNQEIVGLVSALFAYGRVQIILKNQNQIWSAVRDQFEAPLTVVQSLNNPGFQKRLLKELGGFSHRFHKFPDLLLLLKLIHYSYNKYGSIAGHFKHFFSDTHDSIERASIQLLGEWKNILPQLSPSTPPYFSHLLSSPEDKSACKRWCLFLRWMVRKDEIDLGVWNKEIPELKPRHLIIPLDVHLGRISKELKLTHRKNTDWKSSLEVTRALRKLDPVDPIKFDFALTRLGIFSTLHKKTIYEFLDFN